MATRTLTLTVLVVAVLLAAWAPPPAAQALELRGAVEASLVEAVGVSLSSDSTFSAGAQPSDDLSVASTAAPTSDPANAVTTLYGRMPQWAQILCGIVFFLFGLVCCFWGYRFLPFSMFVITGFAAAVLIWAILVAAIADSDPDKWTIVYWASFGTWVVVGTIFACCTDFGLFLMGFGLGAVLALVLNPVALHHVWPENPSGNLIIWICVFGVILGIAAICFKRPLTILATAAGGANLMLMAFGMWIGDVQLVDATTGSTTAAGWSFFVVFFVVWAFGTIIQFCFTAQDGDGGKNL